jgi:hypothetical protein
MSIVALVLTVGLLAYGVLGGMVLRIWRRRTRHSRPSNGRVNFEQWLGYWLPQLVFTEVWVLVGAATMCFLHTLIAPRTFEGPNGSLIAHTFVFGLLGCVVLFAAYDALAVMRARQLARCARTLGDLSLTSRQ